MIRLRPSGADEVLIKRVQDWYEPGPGVFIQSLTASFSPAMLFTGSTTGAWYDPSDFTTLFQDAAGTTPVTAVGQPVGRMLDKSGRGNHAFNSSGNSANFPVLQQDGTGRYYLAFNGTNQWLQTNSIDFTYGDKMFVCAGVRKLSDASSTVLLELSNSVSNAGSFGLLAPDVANKYNYASNSGNIREAKTISASYSAPVTNVVSGITNFAGPQTLLRLDGAQVASDPNSYTLANFGNYPLYLGARAGSSLWFNGRLYQMVVAGKQASASEITNTETFINQKTGAY